MDLSNIVIKDIYNAITVFSKKGRRETMYNRNSYGLAFTTDGQITYIQNKKSYVSNKQNVVILPKGQTYQLRGDIEGDFPLINFECAEYLCDTITIIPIDNVMSLVKKFEQIEKCYVHRKNRLLMISIFYDMLSEISRASTNANNPLSGALEYIEKNYASQITNETLAKSCHLNEEYFRKQFKKAYGVSPKQYIIDTRLSIAKQMLSEGNLKINTISEKCGFSNPYHFCRLFKDKTGLTPSEYMKQNKFNTL